MLRKEENTNEKTEKKAKKKNRKLLLQIGSVTFVYSLLLVLFFTLVIYLVGIFIYVQAKEEQVTENLERLHRTIFEDEDFGFDLNEEVMAYLEENINRLPEVLLMYTDEEESEVTYERYYEYMQLSKEGKPIPQEYIKYAAYIDYSNLFYKMISEQDSYQYKQLVLLDVSRGYEGRILFCAEASEESLTNNYMWHNEEWIPEFTRQQHFGEVWEGWERLKSSTGYQDLLQGSTDQTIFETVPVDGEEHLIGYYPVYVNGNLRWLLAVTYDWAKFQDELLRHTKNLGRVSLVAIMVSEALLLLYVYFSAVRPLRRVKKSLTKYIASKDSATVVKEMSEIKQRNEFGLLADDISTMVRAIDRYTEENMELAGEKEKAATELELAAKIQTGMLRRDFPNTPEVEIYALMDPAKEVGGDFYDFFEVDATHLALVIADVAGKGVPGSLFMMSALTVIRGKTQAGVAPSEILSQVNRELLKGDFGDMFVTVWLGILDLETGILTAANAGHEYPVIRSGEKFELLKDKHGFVVGGMEGVKYQDYEIDLRGGGTLFVYTDGVPEATAANDELYGTDRLLDTLNLYPEATAAELAKNVKLDVDLFVGEAEQFDDLTILCLRYHRSALREEA